jgi:aspartate aminotransferase
MLEKFSYNGSTVMMAPAAGFYATEGLGKNEVRIAYVLELSEIREATECLKNGLEAYKKEQAITNK